MIKYALVVAAVSYVLASPVEANEYYDEGIPLNNTIGINYDRADQSEYFSLSYGRAFGAGGYARLEFAQVNFELDRFDPNRSYSLQLQQELNYPWLLSLYATRRDGADAVEATHYELQLDRFSENASVGFFMGVQDVHLTGESLSGRSLSRDFSSTLFGAELRYYPTEAIELALRYSHYSHDFNVSALNVVERPNLILLLSPDTFGVIDNLDNWTLMLDSNVIKGAWLWGVRLSMSESAVEELESLSVSAYSEFELSQRLTVVAEIMQQRTETFDTGNQMGIGARISF